MLCTELVVPPTIKKAWAAPKASAASSSASRMTELVAQLMNTVPVYGMECRKEESAVQVLETQLRRDRNGV